MAKQDTPLIGLPDTPDKNRVLAAELFEQAERANRLAAKCESDGDGRTANEQLEDADALARSARSLSSNASQVIPDSQETTEPLVALPSSIAAGLLTSLVPEKE
jgi:hypothetical protein